MRITGDTSVADHIVNEPCKAMIIGDSISAIGGFLPGEIVRRWNPRKWGGLFVGNQTGTGETNMEAGTAASMNGVTDWTTTYTDPNPADYPVTAVDLETPGGGTVGDSSGLGNRLAYFGIAPGNNPQGFEAIFKDNWLFSGSGQAKATLVFLTNNTNPFDSVLFLNKRAIGGTTVTGSLFGNTGTRTVYSSSLVFNSEVPTASGLAGWDVNVEVKIASNSELAAGTHIEILGMMFAREPFDGLFLAFNSFGGKGIDFYLGVEDVNLRDFVTVTGIDTLIVMFLGTNDVGLKTPAQFKTGIQSLITKYKAAGFKRFLFFPPYKTQGEADDGTANGRSALFATAESELAATNSSVLFIDTNAFFGSEKHSWQGRGVAYDPAFPYYVGSLVQSADSAYYVVKSAPPAPTTNNFTRSGSTVTIDKGTSSGMVNGGKIRISNATVSAYNGDWTLTSAAAGSCTFTITGTPANATGYAEMLPESNTTNYVAVTGRDGVYSLLYYEQNNLLADGTHMSRKGCAVAAAVMWLGIEAASSVGSAGVTPPEDSRASAVEFNLQPSTYYLVRQTAPYPHSGKASAWPLITNTEGQAFLTLPKNALFSLRKDKKLVGTFRTDDQSRSLVIL